MARELVVRIVGDTRDLERAFRKAERQTKSFQSRMGSVAKAGLFAGVTAGAVGLGIAVRAGFKELAEAQKVAAQTSAALKSTGAVAGVTAKQINTLASSLQQLTGYDDEAIQSAENLMLTFTNVRNVVGQGNDIFNQATQATLDLSRRFGRDLSGSAIQLGKALQDPIRGVTALRRSGIQLSAQQEKLIRRLVESGRVLEAQKIILREVEKQVGGSAKAYGDTFPGQLDILKGSLENLAGELMTTLNPELEKLTKRFNAWLANPENKQQIIDGWTTGVQNLGQAFQFAADSVGALKNAWDKLPDFGKDKGLAELTGLDIHTSLTDLLGARTDLWKSGGKKDDPLGLGKAAASAVAAIEAARRGALTAATGGTAKPPGDIAPPKEPKGITAEQRNRWFDAVIGQQLGRVQDIPQLQGQIARLREIAGLIQQRMDATKDVTRRRTLEDRLLEVQRQIRSDQAQIGDEAKAAAAEAAERKALAQQAMLERLQLGVDRTGLTDTLNDDLKALKNQQAVIRQIIATQGSTLALQQQLLGVEMALKAKHKEIAEQRKAAAEAAKQAAEAAREQAEAAQKAATAAFYDARRAAQFTALGLLPSGDEPIFLKDLKEQLAKARSAVQGTSLDTADLRKQLDGVAKVLSLKLGVPLYDVGQKIKQTLDDIIGKVRDLHGETTKFRHMSSTRFIDALGLNLSPGDRARLRQGLTQLGPGGVLPHQGLQFSGAGARPAVGSGGVVVTGPVTVNGVTDIREFERVITKRAKSRAHTRRGPGP